MDVQAKESLAHAVNFPMPIDPAQSSAEVQELGRLLYLAMAQTLKNKPLDIVKAVAKSNGFKAYSLLVEEYEPKSKNRTLALLQGIMAPTFTKEQFMRDVLK